MAMSEYEKVKVILLSELGGKTTAGVISKFNTVGVTSVDRELGERCIEFATHLKYRPSFDKKFGHSTYRNPIKVRTMEYTDIKGWMSIFTVLREELVFYVDSAIATQKPAWQVMAERNGWGPYK